MLLKKRPPAKKEICCEKKQQEEDPRQQKRREKESEDGARATQVEDSGKRVGEKGRLGLKTYRMADLTD